MTIDLQSFCSTRRAEVDHPFTIGAYTYATDGYIAVRVLALPDARTEGPIGVVKYFKDIDGLEFVSVLIANLPPAGGKRNVECLDCDGRGKEHDCPNCHCKCESCGGSGKILVDDDQDTSVEFRGIAYGLVLFRRVLALPGLSWERLPQTREPTRFRFDGGFGLLMPLTGTRFNHIELGATPC